MTQPALFADPTWTARYTVGDQVREVGSHVVGFVDAVDDDHLWVRYDHPHFGDMVTRYGSDHRLVSDRNASSVVLATVDVASDEGQDGAPSSPVGSPYSSAGTATTPRMGLDGQEPAGLLDPHTNGSSDAVNVGASNPTRVRNTNGATSE